MYVGVANMCACVCAESLESVSVLPHCSVECIGVSESGACR